MEEAAVVYEDDSSSEPAATPGIQRNLLAWTVSIPFIDFLEDEVKREKIPVFCIDVERNDRKDGEGGVMDSGTSERRRPLLLKQLTLSDDLLSSQWAMKPRGGWSPGGTWSFTFWSRS